MLAAAFEQGRHLAPGAVVSGFRGYRRFGMRCRLMRPVRCVVAIEAMLLAASVFRRTTVAVHLGTRGMAIAMILGGGTRVRLQMHALASGARMRIRMRTLGTGTSV